MEILIIIAVLALFVWWFFIRESNFEEPKAPYKVETPVPAHDVAPQPVIVEGAGIVETPAPAVVTVTDQVTDAVTQEAPAKKPRKPRAPKAVVAEKPAAKKAAPKKAAAIKATKKPRSKKA